MAKAKHEGLVDYTPARTLLRSRYPTNSVEKEGRLWNGERVSGLVVRARTACRARAMGSGQIGTCWTGGGRERTERVLTREDREKRGVDGGAMGRRAAVDKGRRADEYRETRCRARKAGCEGRKAGGGEWRKRLEGNARAASQAVCVRAAVVLSRFAVQSESQPARCPLTKGKQSHTQVTPRRPRSALASRRGARVECGLFAVLHIGGADTDDGLDGGTWWSKDKEEEEERTPPDCASKRLSSVSPI